MSSTLEHKGAATQIVKSLGLQPDLLIRAVVFVAADSPLGNGLRALVLLSKDDPALKALVEAFFREHSTGSMYGLRSHQAVGLIIARNVSSNMLLISCHQSLQQGCNTILPVTLTISGAHRPVCAGDQHQLQQEVANLKLDSENLKIDSKRREIRLTKMLSSASQKTQSERELGQVSKTVLVQGDKSCRSCVSHTLHVQHMCIQEHHMHSTCM